MVSIRATTQIEILKGLSVSYLGALSLTSPIHPNSTAPSLLASDNFTKFLFSGAQSLRKFDQARGKSGVTNEIQGPESLQVSTAIFLIGAQNGAIKTLEKLLQGASVELRQGLNRDLRDSALALVSVTRDPHINSSSLGHSFGYLIPQGNNWVQIVLGGVLSS